MKNKGFTLIELLAVIVILAIISVIAIPRILNVVEEAKKGSAEASALGYIDAVEKQIMINATSHAHDEITDNTYPVPLHEKYGVKVKGKVPNSGEIVIEKGKVKTYSVTVDGYTISYDGTTKSVEKEVVEVCTEYEINEVVFEENTKGPYTFNPKCKGRYKLEVWGAQGGNAGSGYYTSASRPGGYGGYAVGEIVLEKNKNIYVNIGEQGVGDDTHKDRAGTYNGGGSVKTTSDSNIITATGGGATHIAYEPGELYELEQYKGTLKNNSYYESEKIIIVAGGGGASGYNWYVQSTQDDRGGSGGGYIGASSGSFASSNKTYYVSGGTQTSGGMMYVNDVADVDNTDNNQGLFGRSVVQYFIATGGGGFYGGGSLYSSGGGSGYIANPKLTNKKMVMYGTGNTYVSNDTETKTEVTDQVSANAESNKSKSGNGAAKITYLGN